jgi:hypothetical protein
MSVPHQTGYAHVHEQSDTRAKAEAVVWGLLSLIVLGATVWWAMDGDAATDEQRAWDAYVGAALVLYGLLMAWHAWGSRYRD